MKLTTPTGQNWNSNGALNPAKAPVVVPKPRTHARVEFAEPIRVTNAGTSGNYDGAELRPYSGRPGAMRAFDLPSLVNGKRTVRVIGCGV